MRMPYSSHTETEKSTLSFPKSLLKTESENTPSLYFSVTGTLDTKEIFASHYYGGNILTYTLTYVISLGYCIHFSWSIIYVHFSLLWDNVQYNLLWILIGGMVVLWSVVVSSQQEFSGLEPGCRQSGFPPGAPVSIQRHADVWLSLCNKLLPCNTLATYLGCTLPIT